MISKKKLVFDLIMGVGVGILGYINFQDGYSSLYGFPVSKNVGIISSCFGFIYAAVSIYKYIVGTSNQNRTRD